MYTNVITTLHFRGNFYDNPATASDEFQHTRTFFRTGLPRDIQYQRNEILPSNASKLPTCNSRRLDCTAGHRGQIFGQLSGGSAGGGVRPKTGSRATALLASVVHRTPVRAAPLQPIASLKSRREVCLVLRGEFRRQLQVEKLERFQSKAVRTTWTHLGTSEMTPYEWSRGARNKVCEGTSCPGEPFERASYSTKSTYKEV